jgi:predicted  nucleic acid-binding Zn-ribbon protein
LPKVDASLASLDLEEIAARRVALESQLQAIERGEDVVALGTEKEQETWRTLAAMEPKLARLPDDEASNEIREKHRFLSGLLMWDLRRDYKARLWSEKKSLGELDRQVREAQRRHHDVSSARTDWPEKFADLSARIGAVRPRVEGLRGSAQAALVAQQQYLQNIAVAELKAQRDRLNTYMVQARFSLASIYDRAAAAAPPTPRADAGSAVLAEGGR